MCIHTPKNSQERICPALLHSRAYDLTGGRSLNDMQIQNHYASPSTTPKDLRSFPLDELCHRPSPAALLVHGARRTSAGGFGGHYPELAALCVRVFLGKYGIRFGSRATGGRAGKCRRRKRRWQKGSEKRPGRHLSRRCRVRANALCCGRILPLRRIRYFYFALLAPDASTYPSLRTTPSAVARTQMSIRPSGCGPFYSGPPPRRERSGSAAIAKPALITSLTADRLPSISLRSNTIQYIPRNRCSTTCPATAEAE
jgi:hypothetical protein